MPSWKGVVGVIAGVAVTVVMGLLVIVTLPILGFASAEAVGNWLPLWVFAIPLVLCPTAGGATTGYLRGTTRKRGAVLGSLAAALGISLFGVVLGLVFLLLLLGMTPASGQATDLSTAATTMATVGGVVGFVIGGAFGALGGVGGYLVRQGR